MARNDIHSEFNNDEIIEESNKFVNYLRTRNCIVDHCYFDQRLRRFHRKRARSIFVRDNLIASYCSKCRATTAVASQRKGKILIFTGVGKEKNQWCPVRCSSANHWFKTSFHRYLKHILLPVVQL